MSIAQLGFAIDSSQAVAATKALNNMAAAAKPATQAATDLSKASGAGVATLKAHTAAANDNAKAHAGLSTQAMAAQHSIRSMIEQLALGMPPTQILAGQLNHLSYAASGPGGLSGAFKEVGTSIAGLLSPMTLIVGSIAAAGAAIALSIVSWKNYALQLDDVRKIAGTTSATLSGLGSSAAIKGISNSDFFTAMRSFSQNVYDARINTGSLVTLLRANGAAATDVQGTFSKVADLVKNAKDDITRINILQQAGLPTTREWIDYMSQGSVAIKLIAAGQKSLGGTDADAMIAKAKEFDERWNQAWINITNGVKSFGLSAFKAFDDLSKTIDKLVKSDFFGTVWTTLATIVQNHPLFLAIKAFNYVYDKIHSDSGATASPNSSAVANARVTAGFDGLNRSDTANSRVAGAFQAIDDVKKNTGGSKDPNDIINANTKLIQQVSILGDLASADQLVAAKQAELSNQFLQTGVGAGKYKDAILNLVRAQAEMSRVQQQAQVGVYDLDKANKAAADTLQMWIDKKLLDPTNATQMNAALTSLNKTTRDLSDAAKVAGSNLPQLQQAMNDASNVNKQIDQFATSSFNNITTGLADIYDGTKSAAQGFSDLGKTVLRSLEEMLIKMYIVLPIFNSLKGILGGGGLLGSLLPSVAPVASANGNVFPAGPGISAYSSQIINKPTVFPFANGIGLMGEAGAEAVMPLTRGANGKLGVQAVGSQSASKTEVHIHGAPNPSNVQVQETVDGRGNRRIDVQLDDAVSAALTRSGSRTQRAMANGYGAKPVGVRR